MPGLEDIIGAGDAVKQLFLWQVLGQVISQAFAPYFNRISELVNAAHPNLPLQPPDLADAVVRNYLTMSEAAAEAAKSGIDAERFAVMVPLHGDAPGVQQLADALMRGLIPDHGSGADAVSFEQGIREGRLADKWTPMIRGLAKQILSPADAADAAVRNFLDAADAEQAARQAGVDADVFATLRHLAGDAPAPGQLAEALRRGVIPEEGTGPDATSFAQGIAEGRLADKWTAMIKALAKEWPTPVQAIDSALKGQITLAEGQALYERLGGDPQFYQLLLNSAGNAPTPLEALQMAYRGIIPFTGKGADAVSYEQAFLEGPWRNKWEGPYRALGEYVPPPETVRTLLEQGAIDHKQAADFWSKYGLAPATVQAYLNAADFNATAETRGLSLSAVLDMYYAQLVSRDDAARLLGIFAVPKSNQELLLAYVDMRRSIAAVNTAVTRIQSLYVARKIGTGTARESLNRLKIPADTIDSVISTWDLEASVNVKTLTAAEIADAFEYAIMIQEEAQAELEAIGYTPYDAWVYLSIKAKGPLPNMPPKIVAPPLGAVIPGVT